MWFKKKEPRTIYLVSYSFDNDEINEVYEENYDVILKFVKAVQWEYVVHRTEGLHGSPVRHLAVLGH